MGGATQLPTQVQDIQETSPKGEAKHPPLRVIKCKQVEERRLRRETLQCCFESIRVFFQINAETLPPSEAFPYLRRKIAYNNSNWEAVYLNMRKAWRRWGMVVRVLEKTGATVRTRGAMYKAVVQSVLLYVSKSWVVTV